MAEEIDPIDFPNLGRFGIGRDSNSLYFDGQKVHTDAVVSLTARQARFAVVVAAATVVAAVSSLGQLGQSVVYIYDTLFRAKPPLQSELGTVPGQIHPSAGSPPASLLQDNEAIGRGQPALEQAPASTNR